MGLDEGFPDLTPKCRCVASPHTGLVDLRLNDGRFPALGEKGCHRYGEVEVELADGLDLFKHLGSWYPMGMLSCELVQEVCI